MTIVDARMDAATVLLDLAAAGRTGYVVLVDPDEASCRLWLAQGYLVHTEAPGRRAALGARLQAAGALSPEALTHARQAQHPTHPGLGLDHIVVRLGLAPADVVAQVGRELLFDAAAEILGRPITGLEFVEDGPDEDPSSGARDLTVGGGVEVAAVLAEAAGRRERLAAVLEALGGPDAVPVLAASSSADGAEDDVVLGPAEWALLCKVDANRTVTELADDCGLTLTEAGYVVLGLVENGLVELDGGSGLPGWLAAAISVDSLPVDSLPPEQAATQPASAEPAEPLEPLGPDPFELDLTDHSPAGDSPAGEALHHTAQLLEDGIDTRTRPAHPDLVAMLHELAGEHVPRPEEHSEGVDDGDGPADFDAGTVDFEDVGTADIDVEDIDVEDADTEEYGAAHTGPTSLQDAADTAALLRELSSLGGFGSDEGQQPRAAARPGVAARPPLPNDPKRKKRGIFGH